MSSAQLPKDVFRKEFIQLTRSLRQLLESLSATLATTADEEQVMKAVEPIIAFDARLASIVSRIRAHNNKYGELAELRAQLDGARKEQEELKERLYVRMYELRDRQTKLEAMLENSALLRWSEDQLIAWAQRISESRHGRRFPFPTEQQLRLSRLHRQQ